MICTHVGSGWVVRGGLHLRGCTCGQISQSYRFVRPVAVCFVRKQHQPACHSMACRMHALRHSCVASVPVSLSLKRPGFRLPWLLKRIVSHTCIQPKQLGQHILSLPRVCGALPRHTPAYGLTLRTSKIYTTLPSMLVSQPAPA